MINWKDEKLRTLLEGVGILSLLLGLIFVGFELRQNTAAVQAATMQGLTDASQEYLLLLASDRELLALYRKGRQAPDQLSEIEADQFRLLTRTRWLRFQNAFLQYRRGTMGDEDWAFYESLFCRNPESSWQDHRNALSKPFVQHVEACWSSNE